MSASTPKKNTFFGGAAILAASVVLVKVIGALYKIPLGGILTDAAFADFNTAYYIYSLLIIISTGGLPVALSKMVSEANALGRNTGRIEAGAVADLILVDFDAPNLIPCHDEAENLVFSAHGSNVWMNMARGKIIYKNGAFLTLDLEKIRAEVKQYALPLIFR